jgi:DNA-binding NarL/FixJ family response regulator
VLSHPVIEHQSLLLRVLVADDSASVNEGLTALISELEGIIVFGCAQDSSKVLMLVQTVHPDVVILDLHVPGTIGLQTLISLKQAEPATTVIVLSHYELPPLRKACLDRGASYFFEKTAAFAGLKEMLTSLLESKQARCRSDTDCPTVQKAEAI